MPRTQRRESRAAAQNSMSVGTSVISIAGVGVLRQRLAVDARLVRSARWDCESSAVTRHGPSGAGVEGFPPTPLQALHFPSAASHAR